MPAVVSECWVLGAMRPVTGTSAPPHQHLAPSAVEPHRPEGRPHLDEELLQAALPLVPGAPRVGRLGAAHRLLNGFACLEAVEAEVRAARRAPALHRGDA